MSVTGSSQVRTYLRRICISLILVSLLLYLPTLFYLASSFSENPDREAFHAAIDVAESQSNKQIETGIPKIIHQIWIGNKKPPARYVHCAKSWERLKGRGYTYRLWNETGLVNFFRTRHPYFLQRWRHYKYTMNRVDTAKYFLLFTFGGIFADMDVCSVASDPVERVMSRDLLGAQPGRQIVLIKGQPAGVNPEIMMGPSRHPFFRHCLRLLHDSDRRFVLPYLYMMCVGGPCFLTGAYKRYSLKDRHVLLLTYKEAEGRIFTPVKGGEWYTWDSKILIEWIYFGIGHGYIIPVWLSSLILAVSILLLLYFLKRRYFHKEGNPLKRLARWMKSRFVER